MSNEIKDFDPNGVGLKNGNFIGLPFSEENAKVVLLTVPWDVTVSYNDGTATAPQNILEASTQLDLYDAFNPKGWKKGIYFRPPDKNWLAINTSLRTIAKEYIEFLESSGETGSNAEMQQVVDQINSACVDLKQWVENETTQLLEKGKLVGLIGGDHSCPLGFLTSLSKKHGQFGILHIDAHKDLRKAYEGFTYSHASTFYNAMQIDAIEKLVQVGARDYCDEEFEFEQSMNGRIVSFNDRELKAQKFNETSWHKQCENIIAELPAKVYVSFDIDGLLPNLCPNTGTPVPGGLEYDEAIYLIEEIVRSGRALIGFDLCEVAGVGNKWDGNVGARLLYKLCNALTVNS